ncbi:hypothetical protein ACK8HX_12435 [Oryzobacter sp. R7]
MVGTIAGGGDSAADPARDGIILDWWYVDEDGETTYLGSTPG